MRDEFDEYPLSPGFKEEGGASEEAALKMEGSAATLRAQVFHLLKTEPARTADEIAGALGLSILSIRPRVSELAKMQAIVRTGERRLNASGMSASVWTIAEGW